MNTTAALLARRAAELIETCGHLKGRMGNREEGFCAQGALLQAWIDKTYDDPGAEVYEAVVRGLDSAVPAANFVDWNDEDERQPAEVISLFRKVADELEVAA